MDSTDGFSSQQISEFITLATSLASVPKEQRVFASNEAAAYMQGFSSGIRATIQGGDEYGSKHQK